VVSADVKHLCLLGVRPDGLGLEVLQRVVVCGTQVSDHGTVVSVDDDAAAAGRVVGRAQVFGREAGFLAGGVEG